jgi:hypothetical protein
MTPKAKKLLDIVKRPTSATPERKAGGTDPMEPWSAQNRISESPNLNRYLLSRGFDPKHTPKDIKVAHSKSNAFKTWQRQHFNEDLTTKHTGTGVDHKTDLSVSPTMKRAATLTKAKKHYEVPNPPGTMRKEETLDEISLGDYKQKAQAQSKELKKHTKGEYGDIAKRMLDRRNKGLKMASKREKAEHQDTVDMTEEKKDKRSASEKMSDYANKRHKVYQDIQNKQKDLMKKWNDDHKDQPHLQVPVPEDVGDPMAAIKGVPVPESRAQKIKAIYKKKVAEDTYDSEKDDKYAENPTFGKKPKLKQVDDKSVDGGFSKTPQAAAILTGGTTLTGQKRDMVEIDPKMKNPRPGQSDPNGDRKQ